MSGFIREARVIVGRFGENTLRVQLQGPEGNRPWGAEFDVYTDGYMQSRIIRSTYIRLASCEDISVIGEDFIPVHVEQGMSFSTDILDLEYHTICSVTSHDLRWYLLNWAKRCGTYESDILQVGKSGEEYPIRLYEWPIDSIGYGGGIVVAAALSVDKARELILGGVDTVEYDSRDIREAVTSDNYIERPLPAWTWYTYSE